MKAYITVAQAESILPEKDYIHTFYDGPCLVGADWERKEILDKLEKSDVLELTGPAARGMGHGLCAYNDNTKWHSKILFIETDEEKLVALEKQLEAEEEESKAETLMESEEKEGSMEKINAICEEILALKEEDFEVAEKIIQEQKEYFSPLKHATQRWQHELGDYNARVVEKIKELRELLKTGANIKKP